MALTSMLLYIRPTAVLKGYIVVLRHGGGGGGGGGGDCHIKVTG